MIVTIIPLVNHDARARLMSWLLFADLSILYSAWFSPIIPKTICLNHRNVTKNKDILRIWSKKFNQVNRWIFYFKEIIN